MRRPTPVFKKEKESDKASHPTKLAGSLLYLEQTRTLPYSPQRERTKMTDFIRTIWHNSATQPRKSATENKQTVDQIRLPTSTATTLPGGLDIHQRIKLEPPASPCMSSSASDSDSSKAQRMARVNARRDKRKPLDTDVGHGTTSKKLKTEAALDPSGEERLRAMEAQLEHLDPDSKEAKKKRRLIRNRMSAQLHRERKKAYVGQLEDQLQAKEKELKALQEQLAAMAVESQQLKQQLSRKERSFNHELQIKTEPVLLEKAPMVAEETAVDWAACLEDMDEAMVGEDLLCDLDESPLTAYGLSSISEDPVATALAEEEQRQRVDAQTQSHHEIHAAKKNLAMVMAMMFSVTFCGHNKSIATVADGSNFSSMFHAVPVKELSQMSIASRIVACLEKTSWEDFQDVSSWTASAASAVAAAVAVNADKKSRARQATSPSAASDVTDSGSCTTPKQLEEGDRNFETDLIEKFVYPVDEPFAPALADATWFGADSDDFGHSDAENDDEQVKTTVKPVPMTSRLYEKLTKLWKEKNQVLMTVLNGKNEVTRRSVADMSTIRKGMTTGALFPITAANVAASSKNLPLKKHDRSVTFLYPLSAFSEDERSAAFPHTASSDHVFLEVSCQINGAAHAVQ
ncbi:bzip transcription [Plasmopara halstedii]|uniref:Bzip transcription n=1 Tax=Plasmopara halstedii TaxID=4781 RepID=A0A0P1ALB5_PLAHL|nr:bzip transcription [Plasmopara halstedii]CEG41929.1 bzip transcription [Plasmopara halstedii]|eukprot:XP_024578298.1 bzip transcription [Plasmopara halstedii]